MASDDGIAAFIAARLDEDEAAAKSALLGFPLVPGMREPEIPADRWYASYHEVTQRLPWTDRDQLRPKAISVADCGPANVYPAKHIARHDPARTLREVEAMRAILEWHHPEWDDYVDSDGIERATHECAECAAPGTPDNWPCRTVRALAAIWSDHPDYRQEWKP